VKPSSFQLIHGKEAPKLQSPTETVNAGFTANTLVGELVRVEADGLVTIDHPKNAGPPLKARSLVQLSVNDQHKSALIAFENGNPERPIIVGIVQDQPVVSDTPEQVRLNREKIKDIAIDGERVTFDAKQEILLRCGEGSIKMRRDGTVIIKGVRLVSRAKTENCIKGASVNIN
jgi:hypothetical protein